MDDTCPPKSFCETMPILLSHCLRRTNLTLLISTDTADEIFTMPDCISALEKMYQDLANNHAISGYRSDMVTSTPHQSGIYSLKMMGGVIPAFEVGAVRINSDLLGYPESHGVKKRVKIPAAPGKRWVGLVLLFSIRTGEPLAIIPDGIIQRMRGAGTSGLGIKYMARKDAKTVALIGAGWQAGAQVLAAAAVRKIVRFQVYSPTAEKRENFCKEWEKKSGIEICSFSNQEAAFKGADIVLCATNSMTPVFDREWLKPGMHVGCIRQGEIEASAINSADTLAVHDHETLSGDRVLSTQDVELREGEKPRQNDALMTQLANVPALKDLVSGNAIGRSQDTDKSMFLNYQGLGIQFAAAGWALYQKAKELGCGHELPTEWFTQDVVS